jgi:protein-L-isoaspartate(D-aspartate) O-methyltransferase
VSTAEALRLAMVAGLLERGELSPAWRPALEQVPRHAFIPDRVWVHEEQTHGPDLMPLDRDQDPQRWLDMSYANDPVFTQVDDGHPDEHGRGREVTSSASMPAVVAQMLDALRAEPGMHVLEIGTGTGYNAALVAHRLGADHVVSVEVDDAVAEQARQRLTAQRLPVRVVTRDGTLGWAQAAPYDRVLATVAARQIPYAWIGQTRPGGLVLLPWGTEWYPSALLRLEVGADHIGRGRIVGPASFMLLREQRVTRWIADILGTGQVVYSTTDLHPWYVASPDQLDAATTVGMRVPGCRQFFDDGDLHLIDSATRSWGKITLTDSPPYPVEQGGTRKLWDEVLAAYQWWREHDEPRVADWLITVGPDGQRISLDRASGE